MLVLYLIFLLTKFKETYLSLFILSLEPMCLDVDLLLGEADALFLFDGVVDRLLGGEPPGLWSKMN